MWSLISVLRKAGPFQWWVAPVSLTQVATVHVSKVIYYFIRSCSEHLLLLLDCFLLKTAPGNQAFQQNMFIPVKSFNRRTAAGFV